MQGKRVRIQRGLEERRGGSQGGEWMGRRRR